MDWSQFCESVVDLQWLCCCWVAAPLLCCTLFSKYCPSSLFTPLSGPLGRAPAGIGAFFFFPVNVLSVALPDLLLLVLFLKNFFTNSYHLPGSPDPFGGQVHPLHASGPPDRQSHPEGQRLGERDWLLCSQRQLWLHPDSPVGLSCKFLPNLHAGPFS